MNNRTNDLLHSGYLQHASVPYDDGPLNRIHVSSVSLLPCFTYGVMGPLGPLGNGAFVQPIVLTRVTSEPSMGNLSRNTNMPRNAYGWPGSASQSHIATNPLLMEDQQNKGLQKLRREIYNPGIKQVSLYYRDKALEKSNSEDDKRCAICLDDFRAREMVTLTPCNHMFHDNCIVPWVKSNGQCPVCRFVISDLPEGTRTSNHSELGNDPFARELISFIRDLEARG
uniref:probable E3 ubiquitin-protein ligase XERICO n=1 Tax=Erigeron canadensis TaxID=72917 RepID=UPI001CB9CAEA|nr:probable E3 ubiquitin-protein ligase XERICO [Erigeron canadensis]